jgi:hypothetical protein
VLVTPYNSAGTAFNTKVKNLYIGYSCSVWDAAAATYVAATEAFDNALLRSPWPATVETDIRSMVTADSVAEGDTAKPCGSGDSAAFNGDFNKATAAANIVRSDIGLPPPPAI